MSCRSLLVHDNAWPNFKRVFWEFLEDKGIVTTHIYLSIHQSIHPSIHPSVLWCFSECGATVYVEKPRSPSNQPAIQVFWSDGTVFWASFTRDTKSLWDDQAPHPISGRKPRQPEKEIISLLISVIPFLWSLTTVHSHRWGWEGRCSNSRASLSYSALSSPQ